MSRGVVSMLSARSARSTPQQPPWGGDPRHAWYEGVLARSHGLVFSSAAGGAHWQIAIRCPSLPFPSVKVHQAAVLVRRFCFSMVAGCVDQNIKDPYGNIVLGGRVALTGMRRKMEMEGKTGEVKSIMEEQGKVRVQMDCGGRVLVSF